MAQSGYGKICLFHDFLGAEIPVALTTDVENLGDFKVGGEGFEDNTAGLVLLDSDGLSGVGQLTSGATDKDTTAVMTSVCFDVALMGPLVIETRIRLPDLDAKGIFVGFSASADDDIDIATDIVDGATGTTLTLNGSNFCGFYWSSELTDDEDWHAVYNGGSTTGPTDSSTQDLEDDAIAGEFQVLRLEIDPNGTARFYIDGVLKKTVTGAVSTTADLAAVAGTVANASEAAVIDLDYVAVEANRDWTV